MKSRSDLNGLFGGKFALLSVQEIGSAIAVYDLLLSVPDSVATLDAVRRLLRSHFPDADAAESVISGLEANGLVEIDPRGYVTSPVVDSMVEAEQAKLSNRKAGWEKRKVASSSGSSARNAASVATKPRKPKAAKAAPGDVVRLEIDGVEEDAVVVKIETNNGAFVEVMRSWVVAQSKMFPCVASAGDLERQVMLAAAWCSNQPGRRKTVRGMPAFLTRWLASAEDNQRARAVIGNAGRAGKNGFGTGGASFDGSGMAAEAPPAEAGVDFMLKLSEGAVSGANTPVRRRVRPMSAQVVS